MLDVSNALNGFEMPIVVRVYEDDNISGNPIKKLVKTIRYTACQVPSQPSDLEGMAVDYSGRDTMKIHTKTRHLFPLGSIVLFNKVEYRIVKVFNYNVGNGKFYKYIMVKNK